jgi:ATP-binding cassette subfamily B protein
LRQNISLVLPESVLFEGTIRDNIALGRPGASEAEIIAAAQKAHIHETILALPEGYEARVREQGKNLSSGQRQRLAIARAILRDTPILILDEPTASLDVEAEAEVMHALETLIEGRTVLTISHRLSTLGHVDEIIVLHKGRIVEHGTFEELKGAGGVFACLLVEQNRYNLERREDQVSLRPAQDPADVGPQSALSPNGRRPQPIHPSPVGARVVGGGGLDMDVQPAAAVGPS